MKAYLSMVLSLPRSNGKRGVRLRELGALTCLLLPVQRSSVHTQLWHIWKTSSKATSRKKKAFKSVPLFSKLQPCIFNFLSPYNVIHWHPSQTWAPAACIALQDKLSSHAVATCQEHRGMTEKMYSLMYSWEVCGVGEKRKKEQIETRPLKVDFYLRKWLPAQNSDWYIGEIWFKPHHW